MDIILTKSISRFARNTVDLLETVRHLKELGIEVRFEEQNIRTLSSDGELMRYQPGQLLRPVSSVTGQIPCLAGSFPPSHRRGGYQPPVQYKLTIISKVGRIRTDPPPDTIHPAAQKTLPGGRLIAAPTGVRSINNKLSDCR